MKLDFVKLINKYNYYYVNDKRKIYFLFSNNSLTNIKKKLVKMLAKKRKHTGSIIISSLNILSKKKYQQNKNSKIKLFGGPLYVKLLKYKINFKNKKIILKRSDKNKVYFPKNYIKKKINLKNKWLLKDVEKSVKKFNSNKLNKSLLSINKINKI
tara:strand:+ start:65 stop:529 length:465 start_codon:yes stop_codon:yes gene_type:complete